MVETTFVIAGIWLSNYKIITLSKTQYSSLPDIDTTTLDESRGYRYSDWLALPRHRGRRRDSFEQCRILVLLYAIHNVRFSHAHCAHM